MNKDIWTDGGRWWKGNLHIHTTCSDGSLPVDATVRQYKDAGYDFISITDHNLMTDARAFSSEKFLVIPGEEISAGVTLFGGEYHILGIGIDKLIDHKACHFPQQAIDEINRMGAAAIVAHPYWSGLTLNELSSMCDFIGIEVFNSSCHHSIGKGRSDSLWDDLLIRRRHVFGFANDDCHNHFNDHRPTDAAVAWNMVKAKSLSAPDIIAALKAGDFYSSWGPEIKSFRIEEGRVHVECSPAKIISIHASAGRGCGETFTAKEGLLSSASYKMRGPETYFRIEITDDLNRTAWSNPIYV